MSLLVTFHSVSAALYARKMLAEKGMRCAIVPVPRSVSSSCGYAMEISGPPVSALAEMLDAANVDWDAIHRMTEEEKGECYETLARDAGGEEDDA